MEQDLNKVLKKISELEYSDDFDLDIKEDTLDIENMMFGEVEEKATPLSEINKYIDEVEKTIVNTLEDTNGIGFWREISYRISYKKD